MFFNELIYFSFYSGYLEGYYFFIGLLLWNYNFSEEELKLFVDIVELAGILLFEADF